MTMKRFAPIFWLALIFLAGGTLMKISYEVDAKRRELAHLQTQISDDSEGTRVLKAEWAYLNQPQRLEKLSAKYLSLEPMKIAQVQTRVPGEEAPQVAENNAAPTPSQPINLPSSGIIKVAAGDLVH